MQLNPPMEGGSERATSSDDGQFIVALRKLMKKEIEVMVIHNVQQVIRPIVEDLIRKVVKEELQPVLEKLSTSGNRSLENETNVSKERSLCLKFLDEVSPSVLTGREIKGKGGAPIRVALVDKITEQVVDCGPASSSKVEILVLEAKDDDNEDNWSREDFNNRIIREGDKKKPHFAKSKYIYLKEGIGTLCNAKLGHDSTWMKSCKCHLGARMESFGSIKVQEAWTESFTVSDSRSKLYQKHYPPSLSDPVWRLEKIRKDGPRCKRLNEKQIVTVQDFLFLHSIDPQKLQQIVDAGADWEATIQHAQTRIIDDKRIYLYYPLSEPRTGVVFDVLGRLKGAIHDSHYVLENDLSQAERDCARKLLLSAFENRNDSIRFEDENALLLQFPSYDLSSVYLCNPIEPDTLSQIVGSAIGPSAHPNNICDFDASYDPTLGVPNQSPSRPILSDDFLSEYFGGQGLISLNYPEMNNISETTRAAPHSHQQSNACSIQLGGAASLVLWIVRARRRVMALGGIHIQKRQRT